ncbi:lipid-A-disaccharide synthase [Desulfonatronovibrio hydrogenovorans]|uniref:lipid-A-disaccharide synthase n=1 Tax=Desulfonatronovibrio hydrogenovorans TaxID=53245 RepID=UPI00048BA8E7|nr:lipid-A-disaccharide synthase [Desulfonatronovibrio hydrogenovorans]
MKKKLVWMNVCETSADNYGARLMAELKRRSPGLEIMGMGGPAMRRAGLQTVFRSEDLSLVGLTEVFSALPRILGYLKTIKARLKAKRPDILILMDAPDFNFRLARMAFELNIPVIYYIAPQAWAWRKSRVDFLRKYVDQVACILPFEQDFFRKHRVRTTFVGHPVMETLDLPSLEKIRPEPDRIAILPGSRKKEISSLLPLFVATAAQLRRENPGLIFSLIQAPGISQEYLQEFCGSAPWLEFISPENRYEYLKKSRLALAASGTVTLECAILEVPAVVAYKLSWISYLVGRLLIHVKNISMPNLILGKTVFPELIQDQANPEKMLSAVRTWLYDPEKTRQVMEDLKTIKSILGTRSAAQTTADLALKIMNKRKVHGQA